MILPEKQENHQPNLTTSENLTLKSSLPTLSKTKSDDLKARISERFKKNTRAALNQDMLPCQDPITVRQKQASIERDKSKEDFLRSSSIVLD
jgi:hypothetical protein